jgi:hypothetical protein
MLILLLVATTASGAPTVATDDPIIKPTCQTTLDTPVTIVPIEEFVGTVNAKLANLGREFLQPPSSLTVLGNTNGNNVKSLPPVPAAILMVLFGFLCVSLVRDHRIWLAALTGLLWAGQVGIQAFPQLTLRLSHSNLNKQQLCAELTYPHYLDNSNRLRSDIEGTQYIGLLRHLAGIPDRPTSTFLLLRLSFLRNLSRAKSREQEYRTLENVHQFGVVQFPFCLFPPTTCLASSAKQFISFSPSFIFANLARGPPIQD